MTTQSGKLQLPWIEKYRPNSLDEMIDHGEKIQTLRSLIEKGEMTHLLFYGPAGCGKTSMILACAKKLYGEQYRKYILELNASDDRGIETVRKKIPDFVKTSSNKVRLVILDEADALTNDAQGALRLVIEKFSKSSRFCLICNNINKIIPGLQSRCTKMRFGYLNTTDIKNKLNTIIEKENVRISTEGLECLINANKDFRQIINTLQCLHAVKSCQSESYDLITPDEINSYLGIPSQMEFDHITKILLKSSLENACDEMQGLLKDNKWNLSDLIKKLTEYVIHEKNMKQKQKFFLIELLSNIEAKLSHSNDAEVQLYYLVAGFQHSILSS